MKKIVYLLMLSGLFSYGQTVKSFEESYETNSGIRGSVVISTKPISFGWGYMLFNLKQIKIIGVQRDGEFYSGNDLSEYGIHFPMNARGGYCYVSGEVSMHIPESLSRDYATFSTGASINIGAGINEEIKFPQSVKDRHNAMITKYGSSWEKTGRVENLKVSKVASPSFGEITRALDNFIKYKENMQKYEELIFEADNAVDNKIKLELLNEAKSYTDDYSALDRKISETQTKLYEAENIKSSDGDVRHMDYEDNVFIEPANSIINRPLKKPYEYSKTEWNGMSKSEQDASLKFQKDEMKRESEELEKATKEANEKIDAQFKANLALAEGNYAKATKIASSAGDNESALVYSAAGFVDHLFKVSPKRQAEIDANRLKRQNKLLLHKTTPKLEYDYNSFNKNDLIPLRDSKGWYGYKDKTLNWVIKPKFLIAYPFIHDKAIVITKVGTRKIISKSGEFIKD